MSHGIPYVQLRVDMLGMLWQFPKPSFFIVFACIGIFDADPLGASKRDVLDYTCLSRPTVDEALRFLELNEFITFAPETRRYRCTHYFRCQAAEKTDIRELVPVHEPVHRDVKENLASPVVVVSSDSISFPESIDFKQQQQTVRELFSHARPSVREPALSKLARSVAPDLAERWVAWLPQAPATFTRPVSYMVKQLSDDPTAEPPEAEQPRLQHWWSDEYDGLIKR